MFNCCSPPLKERSVRATMCVCVCPGVCRCIAFGMTVDFMILSADGINSLTCPAEISSVATEFARTELIIS